MRNLFLFLVKYHAFFLFLFLEIICLTLIVRFNSYHKAGFINSSNSVVGNYYTAINDVGDYFKLTKINDSLAIENVRLRNELENAFYHNKSKVDTAFKGEYYKSYLYTPVKVINNSIYQKNNFYTINRGKSHGLDAKMGIISAQGIAGIVRNCSQHFCVVMSVLNSEFRIRGRITRNNYFGNLTWNGNDPSTLTIREIPNYADIRKGDSIVTTGYSAFFPENILIGVIEDFEVKKGDNFYTADVRLSTDIASLEYVNVATYIFKEEQVELEEGIEDE